MATRISPHTIPSEYIRLDSRVSDPDAFRAVRDEQVLRENHNILLARGIKRHLFSFFNSVTYDVYSVRPFWRNSGTLAFAIPLVISAETRELTIATEMATLVSGITSTMYVVVDGPGASGTPWTTAVMSTSSYPSVTKVSLTVGLPETVQRSGYVNLNMYVSGGMTGTDQLGASCAIDAVGPDFIDIDTTAAGGATPTINEALYIDSNLEITPRLLEYYETLSGANKYRCHVDGGWEQTIVPGTDTCEQRTVRGLAFRSMSIYEESRTFFADPGVP